MNAEKRIEMYELMASDTLGLLRGSRNPSAQKDCLVGLYLAVEMMLAEESSECISRLMAALTDAAMSLETIRKKAGHDECMDHMDQVRGYANSRATVARAVLNQKHS